MPTLTRPITQRLVWLDLEVQPASARAGALTRAGLVVPRLSLPGLVDTGASMTCIDPTLRRVLNLIPVNRIPASLPGSLPRKRYVFKIDLEVVHPQGTNLLVSRLAVVEEDIAHTGVDILVGGDVLEQCRFCYDGPAGMFTLDW